VCVGLRLRPAEAILLVSSAGDLMISYTTHLRIMQIDEIFLTFSATIDIVTVPMFYYIVFSAHCIVRSTLVGPSNC